MIRLLLTAFQDGRDRRAGHHFLSPRPSGCSLRDRTEGANEVPHAALLRRL